MPTKMSLRFRKMLCKCTCRNPQDVNLEKETIMNKRFENYEISIAQLSQFALFVYGKKFPIKEFSMQKSFVFAQNALERDNISVVIIKGKPTQRNINILIFPCSQDAFWFFKDARRSVKGTSLSSSTPRALKKFIRILLASVFFFCGSWNWNFSNNRSFASSTRN